MPPKKKRIEEYDNTVKQASEVLKQISEDITTPRNIRRSAKNAGEALQVTAESHAVRASNAVSILDDVSQDPNMPSYTRTRIWNVVSLLETIKD